MKKDHLYYGLESNKKIDENKSSKLIIFANNFFVTDSQITIEDKQYLLINLYNNLDLVLNSVSYLNNRQYYDIEGKSTGDIIVVANKTEKIVMYSIIFIVPILIITFGIVLWRKKKR